MKSFWAIVKQTIRSAVRTKVFHVLFVFLVAAVFFLPLTVSGDVKAGDSFLLATGADGFASGVALKGSDVTLTVGEVQKVGNLVLDGNRYEMKVGDKSVKLTNKEYQLIELFVLHPGFVFSTEHLMDKIWGFDSDSDIDVVWTHIGFVRKKLRSIDANVEIKTIRGSGYSLEEIK